MKDIFANRSTAPLAGSRVIMTTSEPKHGLAHYVADLVVALANSGVRLMLFCPANYEYADQVRKAGAEVAYAVKRLVLRSCKEYCETFDF
jgi:hypothetical protein